MKSFLTVLLFAASLFSQEISITSHDGFKLYGWLDKPQKTKSATPVILFAHQFGSDHSIWNSLAKKFQAKGYATLNVDLRGHGKSTMQNGVQNGIITDMRLDHIREALTKSNTKVAFKHIPADLILWLERISDDESIDMDNLYVFGSSLGGGSIVPLLNDYDVKGLVSISPGRLDELAEQIDMALSMSMSKQLYIAAKNDPLGAAQRSIEYAKRSISGTAIVVSGNGHGTVLLPQVEEYIFAFINSTK